LLEEQFKLLAIHPFKGKSRDDVGPDLRSYQVESHVIFYVIDPSSNTITISDILHQRMDPAIHIPTLH
jgi:plasmid stabilization system protein ParE